MALHIFGFNGAPKMTSHIYNSSPKEIELDSETIKIGPEPGLISV